MSGARGWVVMAKVYVSSTIADLKRERRAVMDWLVAAGHQPVHSYQPNSDMVRDSCLDDVDACDLYVLILGHRYGFQPAEDNPEGLSITQLEFRRAGQSGIPRIALLSTSILDVSLSDVADPQRLALVSAFRKEVAREVRPAEFGDRQGLIQGLSTGVQAELDKLGNRPSTGRAADGRAAGPALRLAPRPAFWQAGRNCWASWVPGWPEVKAPARGWWRCAGWAARGKPARRWSTRTGTWPRSGWHGSSPPRTRRCWRPGLVSWRLSSGPGCWPMRGDPVAWVHGVLAAYPAEWLLVFDNAPDRASVEAFLPPGGAGAGAGHQPERAVAARPGGGGAGAGRRGGCGFPRRPHR